MANLPYVGVYAPSGRLIRYSLHRNRKEGRRDFAEAMGVKWNALWKRGYRLRAVPPELFRGQP